jgi:nitroimidazol reductase NimA-like FMN-containing flavoprotein (pyridoxamine 5'-phosphate oxidase superfamily)
MPSTTEVEPELRETIADETAVAHLATSAEDRPHAAPVWYRYDDGVVTVLTGGRKLRDIRSNPRVALSIQRDDEGIMEWMAAVRGTAAVTGDVEAVNEAAREVYPKYIGDDPDSWDPLYRSALSPDPNVALVEVSVGSATVRDPR